MTIHIVQPGETIFSIAQSYEVSVERLIRENELSNPDKLVVGQTIVVLYPNQTYIVKEGDTLGGIADAYGISLIQLLRNNPYLSDREFIYPEEELVISYVDDKIMKISTNGYAFPFIDKNILKRTLPFLTYLTIFNYQVTPEGDIIDINDTEIIQIAKEFGVAPVMLISTLTEQGTGSSEVVHSILINQERQNRFIENILATLNAKGYYGVSIDSHYIYQEDRSLFVDFITKISNRLNKEGYILNVVLTPSTFENENGIIAEGQEYVDIGQVVDGTLLLSYEWGYSFGPPAAVTPANMVRYYLNYAVTQIPPEKIYLGIPVIGYIWQLPYVEGVSNANSISSVSAIDLASDVGATIHYDETSQAPFFIYKQTRVFIVWFKDARSIDYLVKLVPEYGMKGIGIWNIMSYFPQMWLIVNSQYEIETVL